MHLINLPEDSKPNEEQRLHKTPERRSCHALKQGEDFLGGKYS